MTSLKKRVSLFFVSLCALFVFFFLSQKFFSPCLILSDRKNSLHKFCIELKDCDEFIISYTHSVNKGRVQDFVKILSDGCFLVDRTRFFSYGAGIPEPEAGQKFVQTEQYLEIQDINLKRENFLLAVGVIANHAIEFDGNVHYLKNFFKPQTSLIIEYKKVFIPMCFIKNHILRWR